MPTPELPSLPPLLVQLVFHPESQSARDLAIRLHHALNDDPAVPGMRIPTVLTPATEHPPSSLLDPEAERVFVVVLADNKLKIASPAWKNHVVALYEACEKDARHRFFPIQLTEHAYPIDPRLKELSFLRAWAQPDSERERFVQRRIIQALCRHLKSEPVGTETDPPPVTLFISHTKADVQHEPLVVKALVEHLNKFQPVGTWFDSGDIDAGSKFAKRIKQGIQDAALLSVLTDAYASREWCRKEVLLAKQHQRPVVVVTALRQREIRSFPYSGNVPVLRWGGDPREAVDLVLKETLRHLHASALLGQRKAPGDVVLPSAPELVTVVRLPKGSSVLYPDPPLGNEELELLKQAGVSAITPLQRYANKVERLSEVRPVAMSLSESGDTEKYGLDQVHLDCARSEIARYLLLAGARLAYGGHLGKDGNSPALFELVRAHGAPDFIPAHKIESWVGWPIPLTDEERAKFEELATFERVKRPPEIKPEADPDFVDEPSFFPADKSPLHRYAWARGMTAMRTAQTRGTWARIVLGGTVGPTLKAQPDGTRKKAWYASRIPGVLEETLLSLKEKQPVYLVGAFGGCARLVLDAMEGREREELTWDFHKQAPHASEMRQLYGTEWWDYPDMVKFLRDTGYAGLHNGLSEEENRLLATTRVPDRIVELILTGLQRLSTPPPAATP